MIVGTSLKREWLVVGFAGSMLVVIFVLRTFVGIASDFQALPLILPIALVAMEYGRRGGLITAVCSGLVIWVSSFFGGPGFDPVDFLIPVVCFAAIALVIGELTTRRKQADEENSRWFELSSDMLATISLEGRLIRLNPAWQQTLGRPPEELIGQAYYDLVHPDDRETTVAARDQLARGEDLHDFENRVQTADGSWRWLLWSARSDGHWVYAVAKDITDRKAQEFERERQLMRAESIARTDPLTGLANRRAWDDELRREIDRSRRRGAALAMMMIDLDDFKELNDSRGHQAGDELLKELSLAWRLALRTGDIAARHGGDEFAILLPGCPPDFAEALSGRLHQVGPEASWSAGIAYWDGAESPEAMMLRADEALYAAKALGGNQSVTAARHVLGS
ncbi:MAG: diguanylate cyclase domain-containing protein [Solirubrobacterales bacterium]